MNNKWYALTAGLGCLTLCLLVLVVAIPLAVVPLEVRQVLESRSYRAALEPRWTTATPAPAEAGGSQWLESEPGSLPALYRELNPGVVNIQVYVSRAGMSGQGAGSGFILDDEGHIVTNHHVVAEARQVTVTFFDGSEAEAQVVGQDADSDLAVLQVDELVAGAHPLPLGDSDRVVVGEPVVAIGNPFALGSSMTSGIVSAVGRTIGSGATPFSIPHAIQTDAAINPGNSGGPLLNMQGEVIGVNAQIRTGGTPANAGVGFAIPASIVRRVVPELIENGSFAWAWLGVSGGPVTLGIARANDLPAQQGAYVHEVTPNSPAERAGLKGSARIDEIEGIKVPIGGDVVVEVDGKAVDDFDALLIAVADRSPGDTISLTILRDGKRLEVAVKLAERPSRLPSGD